MSEAYSDYVDYYWRSANAPYLKEVRLAGTTPARMLRAEQPAGDLSDPPVPDLALGIIETHGSRFDFDFGAGRWRGRYTSREMFLIPANTVTNIIAEDPHALLLTSISLATISPVLEGAGQTHCDFGPLHATPFRDTFIDALCVRLWDEAAGGSQLGSLFADSALQMLSLALLRRADKRVGKTESSRGTPLASWRLRRCLDYLGDHLGENIGLAELASAADLTPLYFAKAFKRATGLAPHQYLVRQRVERAKAMLSDTNLSVAEIAVACGLCDQSHLARWFKRLVGTTPAKFRAER